MRSDSPGPEWYIAPDPEEQDNDELVDVPHEDFVLAHGPCFWASLLAYDDEA